MFGINNFNMHSTVIPDYLYLPNKKERKKRKKDTNTKLSLLWIIKTASINTRLFKGRV